MRRNRNERSWPIRRRSDNVATTKLDARTISRVDPAIDSERTFMSAASVENSKQVDLSRYFMTIMDVLIPPDLADGCSALKETETDRS